MLCTHAHASVIYMRMHLVPIWICTYSHAPIHMHQVHRSRPMLRRRDLVCAELRAESEQRAAACGERPWSSRGDGDSIALPLPALLPPPRPASPRLDSPAPHFDMFYKTRFLAEVL